VLHGDRFLRLFGFEPATCFSCSITGFGNTFFAISSVVNWRGFLGLRGAVMDMNIMKLMDEFGTDDKCREVLEALRWPDGVKCPRCDGDKVSRIKERNQFHCDECRYQFSVTSGTIFHDTHLPLKKWFVAIYLTVESKKGVSANQIKRVIGVSYKTAWYLCHRIRTAMTEINPKALSGTVEADECFIGGQVKGHGPGRGFYLKNKSIVAGIIQRGGDVRLTKIPNSSRKTLHAFIKGHIHPKTELVITDEWPAYAGIADHDTEHKVIKHRSREYVREEIHTNTIENVWSLLKRSVAGSYHKISEKHIDRYLDELEWRFNNRENPYLFRDTLAKLLGSGNLEYRELVAA
jgi:transposase-like protein